MKGLILGLVAVLAAAGGGGVAGHLLQPVPEEPAEGAEEEAPPVLDTIRPDAPQVVSLRDGFIVPLLRDGHVWGHVVLNLGIEAARIPADQVMSQEPVLRDGLTEALFLHGSLGGFDGDFTESVSLNRLRTRLNEVVAARLDDPEARVLIVSMTRQDT